MSLRRPGSPWRLLVHDVPAKGSRMYGAAHHVSSTQGRRLEEIEARLGLPPGDRSTFSVLPGTEFDEIVVGRWLHVEQMGTGLWWMDVGGVTVHVTADRVGRPRRVTVHSEDPVPGCVYEIDGESS